MTKHKIALFFLGEADSDARCYNMINSLLQRDYMVDVYHCSNNIGGSFVSQKNINVYNVILKHASGWLRFYEWFEKLKKVDLTIYKVVVASDLYSLIGLNKKNKTKILYDVRDFFDELPSLKNKPLKKMLWKKLEQKCLKYVNTVFVTAPSDLLICKKKFFSHKHLIFKIIYNYPLLVKSSGNNYLANKFGINKTLKILLYQGVIESGRGIDTMIDCVLNVPNLCAVFIGEGKDKKKYQQKIKKLHLSSLCFFHNKVKYKNLLQMTCSADLGAVFIEPNSKNNFFALPNKLFEYAVCGLPVIGSNLPNINRYIKKNKLGRAVNLYNKQKIYKTISILLKTKSDYSNFKTEPAFSWKNQEKIFLDSVT